MAGNYFEDLVFKVIADTKSAQEGLTKIGDKVQELNKHAKSASTDMEKLSLKAKVVAGAIVTAFTLGSVAVLKFSTSVVKAAGDAELSILRLQLTLRNVTGATEETAKGATEFVKNLGLMVGVADGELRPALDQLARSTRNLADSQKLLGLALDVSAGSGFDILTVSTALGAAYNGNFTQLQRMKLGISDANIESKDFQGTVKELSKIFADQAAKQAGTFNGQMAIMKTRMDNAKESIGKSLMPAFEYLVKIMNATVVPAFEKFAKFLERNPELIKNLVLAMAQLINFSKDFVRAFLPVVWIFTSMAEGIARTIQGLGWITKNKEMKDWGRTTAEALEEVTASIGTISEKMKNFDASKYVKDLDFSFKMPDATGVTGTGGGGKGLLAAVASNFNDNAKAILDSISKIKDALSDILKTSIKQEIKDLSVDPLTKSLREAKDASIEYKKAQNSLIQATEASARADLAWLRSMADITDKGKVKTETLKGFADTARDNAIKAGNDTQQALQKIAQAQKAYIDETINRIKSFRSAFQQATSFDIGSAVQNIQSAKKELADAEDALRIAQNKFKTNITAQSYAGVIIETAVPLFEAEKKAVDQARQNLAVALGEKKNPFTATVEELQKVLNVSYENAVDLSKTAGDLAGAGFSQDMITQIIAVGPVLGTQIGKAILATGSSAQTSFKDIFGKLQTVSTTGVNDLSISLNQGAIDAMESFMAGLQTISDPMEALFRGIENRVNAMVKTIADAIAALLKQLQDLANVKTPVASVGPSLGEKLGQLSPDILNAVTSNTNSYAYAEQVRLKALAGGQSQSDAATTARWTGQAVDYFQKELATAKSQGVTVNITANTMASSEQIAKDAAWAIKTSSDVQYSIMRAK
jgi:hypothetical protein